eukprot:4686326-Amphidinium_carterae.1
MLNLLEGDHGHSIGDSATCQSHFCGLHRDDEQAVGWITSLLSPCVFKHFNLRAMHALTASVT